jgi:hypothetical protein
LARAAPVRPPLLVEQPLSTADHRGAPNPATELIEIRRSLDALSNLVGDDDPSCFENLENTRCHCCGIPIDADCSYSVRVEGASLTYRAVSGEQSVFELTPDEYSAVASLGDEPTLRATVEEFSTDDCENVPDGSTRLDIAWSNSEAYALEPVATCIAEGSSHPLRPIAAKVWALKLEYAGLEL